MLRADTSIVLECGFPGVDVELRMDDAWCASYTQALSLQPWTSGSFRKDNLGAATIDVRLETDAGRPVGSLSWRAGSVLFVSPDGAGLGEDPSRALVDWLAQELQRKPAAALPASWRTHLEREVATGESPIHGIPSGPTTSPRCTTACTDWMSGPWDDLRTNCYGYACRTGSGIAIPGKGGGEPIGSSSTVDRIRAACESDGLRYLPEGLPAECGTSGWFIAVVWRRAGLGGFHSYRLNRDGTWSHKDGSRFARSVDDTQRPIEALQTAWFHYGDEFRFVGFFHCPPGHRVA